MFSKSCEYGLKAMIYVAKQSNDNIRVSLVEIAEKINSPAPFTAKILQQLSKKHLIKSVKGPNGGFEIEDGKIDQIKLIDIVSLLDGDRVFNGCGLGLKQCDEKFPCPLHHKFVVVRGQLKEMLQSTSLLDMIDADDAINMRLYR